MQTLPPYISFNIFLRILDQFGGVAPDHFESDSLAGLSVSSQSQVVQAMRFLGLIRPDGSVTPEFKLLVQDRENRPAILTKVFRRSYPDLFGTNPIRVSEVAARDLISRTGLSPATQRKGVTFILNAASYMNVPVDMTSVGIEPVQAATSNDPIPMPNRRSMRIELASGGVLEVGLDVDLFRMDKGDRAFVFDLIDKLHRYREDREQERLREMHENDDIRVAFIGDTQVPF